jgi:hypothetical protein
MSIDEVSKNLEDVERRINGGSIQALTIYGGDMAAQIANRVIDKGENSDGGKFSDYSQKEVPAFFFYGKSRNAGGEAKVKAKAKKKEGVSYSEFRGFNGLGQVKNFSFTNAMWRGFGVKQVEQSAGIYTLTLGGKTEDSADKIGWMSGQEKRSIIAPNQKELEAAKAKLIKFILNG